MMRKAEFTFRDLTVRYLYDVPAQADTYLPMILYIPDSSLDHGYEKFISAEFQRNHPCSVIVPEVMDWVCPAVAQTIQRLIFDFRIKYKLDICRTYLVGAGYGAIGAWHLAGSYVSKEQPSVIDDATIKNGFYEAPTVVCVFCQDNFIFKTADAFCMMENMILQATELGIASCIISRGYETFATAEGKKLMKEWGVPEGYACQGFVILGYIDGEQPHSKPRKQGRVNVVE